MREPLDGAYQNDQWITDADAPDPATLPRIPGVQVLVRPVSIRRKSAGGILIPDSVRADRDYLNTVGRVLALGDLAFQDVDIYKNGPWCGVGDYVVYNKLVGHRLWWKGVRMLLLPARDILLVVEKPDYLDSNMKD